MKMKSFLLLFFMILVFFLSNAQPYKSIFNGDTIQWNTIELIPDDGGTVAYYSYSDTTINGDKLHKIYKEELHSAEQKIGNKNELCGYIQEDTTTGKYWFLKDIDNSLKKGLFMDLGLNAGDSVLINRNLTTMEEIPFYVDSVYSKNDHKTIVLRNESLEIKYMEEIGPSYGFYLSYPNCFYYARYPLVCKFNNDTLKYSSDSVKGCYWPGSGDINDFSINNAIKVYPNPTKQYINVEFTNIESFEKLHFVIYNSKGNKINSGLIKNELSKITIGNSGIFFIIFFNTEKEILLTKKIIKL